MPRNEKFASTPDINDVDPLEAMRDAQVDGKYETTDNPEAENESLEDSVDTAADRVSAVEAGQEFVANLQDRYGERAQEIKEAAKTKLRSFGKAAGAFAKKSGLLAVGIGVVGVGAGIAAASRARQDMRDRKARRQAVAQKRLEQARVEQAQRNAFASYEDNIDYSQAHEEALEENETRKQSQEDAFASYQENIDFTQAREAQQDAYASYEDNIDYSQAHEEALEENERFDNDQAEKQRQAEARAERIRKADAALRRKAQRRQRYETIKATGSEALHAASMRARSLGRAVGAFAKRTAHAAGAGARAAAASWQELPA